MIHVQPLGGITRFELARPVPGLENYWTVCYLVEGLLVDSGCAHAARELEQALRGTTLRWIVNTHTHEDHIGANGVLQAKRPGLEIRAHPLAVPVLADPRRCGEPLQPYRRLFWGWPTPSRAGPIADGEVLETASLRLRAIYTPGHSADHLCLYEENRGWLFSGDLFSGGKDRALRQGYDIWQIIASLKRVAALPIRVLYPGSARVRENPQAELHAKIAYLEELGGKVRELHQQGKSVGKIARQLLGKATKVEWVTLGHFSRRWLVRSYLNAEG